MLRTFRCTALSIAILSVLAVAAPLARAQAVVQFDLPAQPLADSLRAVAKQTNSNVLFDRALVRGRTAPALKAQASLDAALNQLLDGSGLKHQFVDEKTITVVDPTKPPTNRRPDADARAAATPTTSNLVSANRNEYTRLAQAETGSPQASSSSEVAAGTSESLSERRIELEELIVTGTRIRGVADQFSPVTRFDRDDMDLAGAATVADVFDKLPQNFGGGVGPDTTVAGSTAGAGAAGINLWGLGNEATLVLLNGRRLAPGGLLGNFVDVSAIPASAIDRIEVLPDGASAIYGTDAIAGVVNIIMRDDFSGAETRLGASGVDGGGETVMLGQTFGWKGERSHGLLTYQYLEQNELDQNDRDFSRGQLADPNWLLPASEINSVFATGGVEMTPRVSLDFDAYYNRRDSDGTSSTEIITASQTFQTVEVEQYGAAGGLHADLASDWTGDVSLTYSASSSFAVSTTNMFGDITDDASSDVTSIDASIGGPLFRVTGEPVELVIGLHARAESMEYLTTTSGGFADQLDEERRVYSGYFELYAPLIGPGDGVSGVHRLALTAAARYDDYDDVGSSFDPRVGLTWSPLVGYSLRGTWSTAFRAPQLWQLRDVHFAGLGIYADPEVPSGQSVALVLNGYRTDLAPEEADVWTVGFDFEPTWLEGLRLRATYFDIDYDGRVAFPQFALTGDFHFTGNTGTVIRGPSAAEVQALADNALVFTNYGDFFPIGPLTLTDVETILDVRERNMSNSTVRGVDVDVSYGVGSWSFTLNGAFLTEFTQQVASTTPVEDLLNSFANPVDLRLRGGVSWRADRTTASLFVNHLAGYTDDESTDPTFSIDDWTTLDASLRFDFGRRDHATSLTLTIENLLDEDPPQIGPRVLRTAIYDGANADPSGRRIGLLFSKRW